MVKRILSIAAILITLSASSYAQQIQTPPPPPPADDVTVQPRHEMPAFNIRKLDSVSVFNTYNIPKGKAVVLMLFMPECEHCQKMTERLIAGMDTVKNINFYLFSPAPLFRVREFYAKYHLAKYKNIILAGECIEDTYAMYYKARAVPYLTIYDRNKKYLRSFESTANLAEMEMLSKQH
ncbi:MAG: hypothetical protein H0X33_07435 [Taibaiella sp.]|nr:hypothetical protein [Taibaiella sp.]